MTCLKNKYNSSDDKTSHVDAMKEMKKIQFKTKSRIIREVSANFGHHEQTLRQYVKGYVYLPSHKKEQLKKKHNHVTQTVLVEFGGADAKHLMEDLFTACEWTNSYKDAVTNSNNDFVIIILDEKNREIIKKEMKNGDVLCENPIERLPMLWNDNVKFDLNSWPARWTALIGCSSNDDDESSKKSLKEYCQAWLANDNDIKDFVKDYNNPPPPQIFNMSLVDLLRRWKDCPSTIINLLARFRAYENLFKFVDQPVSVKIKPICWKRKKRVTGGGCPYKQQSNRVREDNLKQRLLPCKIDEETEEYWIMCYECDRVYQVWHLENVPGNPKSHRCPYCRLKKCLVNDNLKMNDLPIVFDDIVSSTSSSILEKVENFVFKHQMLPSSSSQCNIAKLLNEECEFLTYKSNQHKLSFLCNSATKEIDDNDFVVILGGREEKKVPLQEVLDFDMFKEIVKMSMNFEFDDASNWATLTSTRLSFYKYLEKETNQWTNDIVVEGGYYGGNLFNHLNILNMINSPKYLGKDGIIVNDVEFWNRNFINSDVVGQSCCLCWQKAFSAKTIIHASCFDSIICHGCLFEYIKSRLNEPTLIKDTDVSCFICNTPRVNQLSTLYKTHINISNVVDCLHRGEGNKIEMRNMVKRVMEVDMESYYKTVKKSTSSAVFFKCNDCRQYEKTEEEEEEEEMMEIEGGCCGADVLPPPKHRVCHNCIEKAMTVGDNNDELVKKLNKLCMGENVEFTDEEKTQSIFVTVSDNKVIPKRVKKLIPLAKKYFLSVDKDLDLEYYQECPVCNVMIVKSSDCHAMECTNCKRHFCWICKWVERNDDIYDHLKYNHDMNYMSMAYDECFWTNPVPTIGYCYLKFNIDNDDDDGGYFDDDDDDE